MKSTLKSIAAIGTVIGVVAPSAFAGISATLYYQNDGQPSGYRDPNTVGGEFTAVLSGTSGVDNNTISTILSGYSQSAKVSVNGQAGFETFCVENNVNFNPGSSYSATLSQNITPGKANAINTLTQGVAWLYSQFATGVLSGYNYTSLTAAGREASATALQNAIWYLQKETTTDYSSDPFVQLAEKTLGGLSKAEETTTTAGANNFGVDVLDLSTISNGQTVYAQDQLVYCPVPEPSTIAAGAMLLLPLGWTTLRALRSRKSSR